MKRGKANIRVTTSKVIEILSGSLKKTKRILEEREKENRALIFRWVELKWERLLFIERLALFREGERKFAGKAKEIG